MSGTVFQLLLIGIVIGANNFAVSLSLGALGQKARRGRIVLVFAVFEFLVPLIGIMLGQRAAGHLASSAEWLGPLLLIGLGMVTLWESRRDTKSQEALARRVTGWGGLIGLAAGLSVDNLVAAFGLGLIQLPPLVLATNIMVFSVLFSWIGLTIGDRARRSYETLAEIVTGLLLIGLGIAAWLGWF